MHNSLIEVRNLSKKYLRPASTKNPFVLRDVSFDLFSGEILGIVGRNGAGKSTLLKILSNIISPTSGYADVFAPVTPLLELGSGFHPDFTGRQNIFLEAPLLGFTREQVQAKLPEIISFSEIKNLDQPLKHFSSGMIIRLAFSLAIQSESPILILDETLGGGDFGFKEKSLDAIHQMAKKGRAIIIVAHDQELIKNHCSRVLWLEKGVLVQNGSPEDVVDNYINSFIGKCRLPIENE